MILFRVAFLPICVATQSGAGPVVLAFQHRFVDTLLSITLDYDHILYVIEISNHNFQRGEVDFQMGNYIWNAVQKSGIVRPINNTKIYGSNQVAWTGSDRDGKERFWRNVVAGHASVRFHRQPSGLGHSEEAMAHVRSMRMFADVVDVTPLAPRTDLLSDRAENEAYCLAEVGPLTRSSSWMEDRCSSTLRH